MNFFRLYRQRVFDHRFTENWHLDQAHVQNESSVALNDSESFSLEHLAENPFAGAPASQMVTIPSRKVALLISHCFI